MKLFLVTGRKKMKCNDDVLKRICSVYGLVLLLITAMVFCACQGGNLRKKELNVFDQSYRTRSEQEKLLLLAEYLKKNPRTQIKDEILYLHGSILLERQEYEEAGKIFSQLLQFYPYSERLYEGKLGKIKSLYHQQKFEDVVEEVDDMLKSINRMKRALETKSVDSKKNRSSIKAQIAATENRNFLYQTRLLYGDSLYSLEKYQDARFQYKLLSRMVYEYKEFSYTEKIDANLRLAKCHDVLFEFNDAISLAQRNIRIINEQSIKNVSTEENYLFLASVYRKTGQATKSITLLVELLNQPVEILDREKITTMVSEIIRVDLGEKDLLDTIKKYEDSYPGPETALVLLDFYDRLGRYENSLELIDVVLSFITNEEMKSTLKEKSKYIEVKLNVEPYTIGFIGPVSGQFAPLGLETVRGARLAIQLHNESLAYTSGEAKLVEFDSLSDSTQIPDLIDRMVIEEKVISIVGPMLLKSIDAALPKLEEYEMVSFTPTSTIRNLPAKSRYVFRNSITNEQQVTSIVRYVMGIRAVSSFVVLYPNTAVGTEFKEAFIDSVQQQNGKIVKSVSYAQNTNDFSVILENLKGLTFDAVFIPDYAFKVAQIAPQLRFHDMNDVLIMGTNMLNSPELITIGGKYVEGVIFTDDFFVDENSLLEKSFSDRYHQAFGLPPTRYAAQTFDIVSLILKQINNGVRTRADLRSALNDVRDYKGITGMLSIQPDGECWRNTHILTVSDGQVVRVQ